MSGATPELRLYDALATEAVRLARRLTKTEWLTIAGSHFKAAAKERKKAAVDERSRAILNVYPRRVGGDASLVAISKAIATDGFETVLERTTEYASAVARWAPGRKKSQSGSSLIPMPTTWFNARRYNDDPADWWEGTGGKPKSSVEAGLPEPRNWRAHHPESRYVKDNEPWNRIDVVTQRWIVENTPS